MTSCMPSLLGHWSSRGILALTPDKKLPAQRQRCSLRGHDEHPQEMIRCARATDSRLCALQRARCGSEKGCCCFWSGLTEQTVHANMSLRTNWQEPSSTHRCECSRARKLALNSGTTGGARKMASIPPKKPLHPNPNRHYVIAAITTNSQVPFSVAQLDVHDSGDEENLRHCHCTTVAAWSQGRSQPSMNCAKSSTMCTCRYTQRACNNCPD